jgi:sugar transferase EpsL
MDNSFSYTSLKDIVDRLTAFFALLLLSVPLIVVALLVRWRLGSPVFFRQLRPGYREQPFWLLKFRTMTNQSDSRGNLLPEAQRLTVFGRWLRASSIDELPALINILRGDLSFIGPRPLLMQYLPLYSSEQACRHDVKPGFSGWAQINGRNAISWEERLKLDVWYVHHISFPLDLKILFLTIFRVGLRHGVTTETGGLMPVFKGNQSSSDSP